MLSKTTRERGGLQDTLVFCLLIAIGVAGRWGQPDWCFTPTAAVTVFAGFYFDRKWIGLLVPLGTLGISDLLLPAYDSRGVMLAVYGVMTFPLVLGFLLRHRSSSWESVIKLGICGLLPATMFFLITNWAVWQFKSDYDHTLAGLASCYAAAFPFFRAMLAGDLFYLTVLFGCYVIAMSYLQRPARQLAVSPRDGLRFFGKK